jgi:hypothetical protein
MPGYLTQTAVGRPTTFHMIIVLAFYIIRPSNMMASPAELWPTRRYKVDMHIWCFSSMLCISASSRKPSIHQIALCSPKGNLNVVKQAFALVVARSSLEIGSNLNWTELNTVPRFKVQASLEPALHIWFNVHRRVAFRH